MGIPGGALGGFVWEVVLLLESMLAAIWGATAGLLSSLLGSLWAAVTAALALVFGVIWGAVLVAGLLVAAMALTFAGVDDVYGTLSRIVDRGDGVAREVPDLDDVADVDDDAVTDDAGRFSPAAFESTTGLSPGEFLVLFVTSNGGRVRQPTLYTCLPWSKSTVSRLLSRLEEDDVVMRVTVGRENIVCTPDAAPEQPTD